MASLQRIFERYLGRCVKMSLERERPLVIAVAGSVGKTSTKSAIGIALGALEPGSGVVMAEKNYNNELGVPLVIFGCDMPRRSFVAWLSLLCKAGCTAIGLMKLRAHTFVLEFATDKPGDLAYLVSIAKPSIGVLTSIAIEHTEFLGSIEGVAEEESVILRTLEGTDVAVVNADDRRVMEIARQLPVKWLSFGMDESATERLMSTSIVIDEMGGSGIEITFSLVGRTHVLRLTGTIGRPQGYAVGAALACVAALDHDLDVALSRLKQSFHGMPGRMKLIEGIKRTWLIDDSYNSSPLAVESALHDLARFPVQEGGRRIAALGDMRELGSLAEAAHEEEGKVAAEAGIDMLVVCGTLAHVVARGARAAGMAEEHIFTFASSSEAGLFIQSRLKTNDVVLIKGSQNTIRMERIVKELMAHPERAKELLVRQSPDWLARP